MERKIPEIELNFSNKCSAKCFICSEIHGNGNIPLMPPEVFYKALEQLKAIDFDRIQVGGDGDAFANPYFITYLRELKKAFPGKPIIFYSNFLLYTKEKTNIVIAGGLINRQFTRIDSLDPVIFKKSTGIDSQRVFDNIKYFVEENRDTEFYIGYSSIPQYYRKCKKLLNKLPVKAPFTQQEVDMMSDEFNDIREYFGKISTRRPIIFYRINQSLWEERLDPKIKKEENLVCPKLSEGLFDNVIWICPDGRIGVCPYDCSQSDFTVGSILNENIFDIWQGDKRRQVLENIKNRVYKNYPCNNPVCCQMYADEEKYNGVKKIDAKELWEKMFFNDEGNFIRPDVIIRCMAIKEYLITGKLSEVYLKIQRKKLEILGRVVTPEEEDFIKSRFEKVVLGFVKKEKFNKYDPLIIGEDYKLIDGSHKVACAIFFGVKEVYYDMRDTTGFGINLDDYKDILTEKEVSEILKVQSEILKGVI